MANQDVDKTAVVNTAQERALRTQKSRRHPA
jgi:hypothetical protein